MILVWYHFGMKSDFGVESHLGIEWFWYGVIILVWRVILVRSHLVWGVTFVDSDFYSKGNFDVGCDIGIESNFEMDSDMSLVFGCVYGDEHLFSAF